MRLLTSGLALAALGCTNQPRSGAPARDTAQTANTAAPDVRARSPELSARADSLERLDAEREARAAIGRGDLRFLAVCGYACVPVGVPVDSLMRSSDSFAVRGDSVRRIPGTSDAVMNQDVARLNRVAAAYASRYNRVIWERRKELAKS